jgi:hypothetical protein
MARGQSGSLDLLGTTLSFATPSRFIPALTRNSFHVVFRIRSGTGSMPCRSRICAVVLRASSCPRLDNAPWIRRYPQSRFSSAMRTTKDSISPAVHGRPGARWAVPSYFWAIHFRCYANKVSGVTMVAIWSSTFRPNTLALAAN